jgi:hypothetical protein
MKFPKGSQFQQAVNPTTARNGAKTETPYKADDRFPKNR